MSRPSKRVPQLNRRYFLAIEKLKREEKAAAPEAIGIAWCRFVVILADSYRDMTGKNPSASELSRENEDTARPSEFAIFSHSLMMQIPSNLREHTSGERGNIRSFSTALRKPLGIWKGLRGIQKKENVFPV
jgi:hypothetical protein